MGLASSPWQHLDDTRTRVNGQNGYCHTVCHPLYTAYFTTAAKDRLTIIDVLTNHRPRRFLVNAEALGYLETLGLATVRPRQVGQLPWGVLMDNVTVLAVPFTSVDTTGAPQAMDSSSTLAQPNAVFSSLPAERKTMASSAWTRAIGVSGATGVPARGPRAPVG